ncbi:MAG: hypothetical protein HKN43_08660 [Rhodothermales bacterium]|nr:hypothetical protein [Rhodothermales bacterium]
MGQQQLLLLVFGIVIVAVAVIAGMEAFSRKMEQSAADNLVDRNLTIASEAVAWKTKRDPYNGGNASYLGLATDGLEKLFLSPETNNGTFAVTYATVDNIHITGVSNKYPNLGSRTYITNYTIDSTVVAYDSSITLD